MFLVGVLGLAASGCDDAIAPRPGPSSPPGNPLEDDNGLGGSDATDDSGICVGFGRRMIACGNEYSYREYDLEDYVSYCEFALAASGGESAGCGDAVADLFACIARQDCQSFACTREEDAADLACGSDEGFWTGG